MSRKSVDRKWTRAVWFEENGCIREDVVLTKWFNEEQKKLYWPVKTNPVKAEKEDMDPAPNWKEFELTKVKIQDGT